MEYYSSAWNRTIQRKYCVISTMDQPGVTLWVTQQCIKLCGLVLLAHIIQIYSHLCLQVSVMLEVCQPKQEVNCPIATYRIRRTISTLGPRYYWWDISHTSKKNHYILTTTNYTRWVEAVPLKQVNDQEVINLLKKNIISRFDVSTSPVFYNATYFSSLILYDSKLKNGIVLKRSTNYYLQGNGLDESTKKNLIHIIKKIIFSKKNIWHSTKCPMGWPSHAKTFSEYVFLLPSVRKRSHPTPEHIFACPSTFTRILGQAMLIGSE